MTASDSPPDFAAYVADHLSDSAEDLTDEWIEHLASTLGVRPSRLLPTGELRDHIPAVIRGLAEFVVMPVRPVRSEVLDRLRLLAELRREQGYDVEELLLEFETLRDRVSERVIALIEEYPVEPGPMEVAEVSGRLFEALAGITRVTVGAYRQEEHDYDRALAQRLSDYTRAITHELKTPLSAASAGAEMLQMGGGLSEDKRKRYLSLVVHSLERIDDLIEDISTVAVVEGARAESRWIPLREAVQSVFEEVREAAEASAVDLEIDGELPDIQIEASRIEIALMNLVVNAIKYCDPDKQRRWVRVGAEATEEGNPMSGAWKIRVSDNGLGIPHDLQNKVFQRHFRAHPEVAQGTGLGLSITHFLLTQRGGSIEFESEPGEGTTFFLTVPQRLERPEERGGKRQP